jgi:nucleoid DNA-binding protein
MEAVMTRADLIRILMNTELEEHRNLTREQARAVVSEIFEAIKDALRNGEVVSLPVGNFEVCEQPRQPLRRWFLKRVRVTYKQRNVIKLKGGGEYDLEPPAHRQPPHSLDSKGEMKHSEIDSTPPKVSPAERRKLVAIGIKAGKSRRLIAHELNVTPTTIARDLELLGITANKKPTATIRKPAVVFKSSRPAISDRKVAWQNPTKPFKLPPRPVFPRPGVPEPLKPKPPSPAIPLGPAELRQQHLEEMLQLVGAWLVDQKHYYSREETVLDKARNSLTARRNFPVPELPESPRSAAQLRDHTRPPEMDAAIPQGTYRTEEVCAKWLANWLAAWEPKDEKLRNQVLNQTRARVTA